MDERMRLHQQIAHENFSSDTKNSPDIINLVTSYIIEVTQKELWVPLYIEFLANSHRSEEMKNRMSGMYEAWRGMLVQIIDKLREENVIQSKLPSDLLATTIIAIFDGFNIQHQQDNTIEVRKQIQVVSELLFMDEINCS
ncbi:TetR family transcriptional regulator C-terminal domain-containing protein [Ectobacillus sp. JY-23]|uniref:TetR family transcriptional regulator C-terminal domain-containing protein n=1 Tax=Ectobacillus sp. JY-23 TaxID=2933872 RepID=UPI001FF20831|nr:TetR family transcriptional regulator C-terminal domain-containing protein [Ectobacillus sp. JY-23]UOY93697.1 TetR family transcriptional regulator C-terminal domain-containing protein [Ectobacillus sp. JY-23]